MQVVKRGIRGYFFEKSGTISIAKINTSTDYLP
jgi:hypothetical protein